MSAPAPVAVKASIPEPARVPITTASPRRVWETARCLPVPVLLTPALRVTPVLFRGCVPTVVRVLSDMRATDQPHMQVRGTVGFFLNRQDYLECGLQVDTRGKVAEKIRIYARNTHM